MKTLDTKKVKRALDSAMIDFTMVYIRMKTLQIKMVATTALLFICLSGFSQKMTITGTVNASNLSYFYCNRNFKSIDFRGKTSVEIAKTFGMGEAKCWASTRTSDGKSAVDFYRSSEFGNILFYYTPKGACFKIIIKTPVNNPIRFDESVIYTAVSDKYNIIYTVE